MAVLCPLVYNLFISMRTHLFTVDKTDDTENKGWMILTMELNDLKLEKKNFIEDRVSTPDPNLVRNQAFDLSKILRDDANQQRFLKKKKRYKNTFCAFYKTI